MIINLKTITYYYLTTGNNKKRESHIEKMLKGYIHNQVNPILLDNVFQSGAMGHCRMVDIGLRNQSTKIFQPFAILEDDVSFSQNYSNMIIVPDNADAVYIGISPCGIDPKIDGSYTVDIIADDIDDKIVRIYNMLSTHAIIICSPSYAAAYQRCMMESFCNKIAWDTYTARIQPYYNVYALKNPILYQDPLYNGQYCTDMILKKYRPPNKDDFKKINFSIKMCYNMNQNTKLNSKSNIFLNKYLS